MVEGVATTVLPGIATIAASTTTADIATTEGIATTMAHKAAITVSRTGATAPTTVSPNYSLLRSVIFFVDKKCTCIDNFL